MRNPKCGILLLFLACALFAHGQVAGRFIPPPFYPLVERLAAFGKTIPQEKVYVHMDNTCYFQGDTIWFSAYTRNTCTDVPSQVSGVLYAELLNNDGYLVERKMIEMKEGRGNGFFVLDNVIQYSGFYELRAYTRWQLNWGVHEHKHSKAASEWFLTKEMEQEYYRDYDKLYSRVFPVYDRPKQEWTFAHNMTLRTMRRYFRKDMDKRKPTLTLFPEGGNLVQGVPNRVAFEAAWTDGRQMEGRLALAEGDIVPTVNRGRGVFTITPEAGKAEEVTFTASDGQTVKARLPKPDEQGVALSVEREPSGDWHITAHRTGRLSADSLALTIMHEGRLTHFRRFAEVEGEGCIIPEAELQTGVQQATVFDTQGHVWADRLFFVTKAEDIKPTLVVKGLKDEYQPHEEIRLEVEGAAADAKVSIAVRDAYQADGLFDNGTILTEMLLASEIRGFVPDAGWFFEKNDAEHRKALDLLMMTQGWRRFSWRDMAVKGEWELTQPDERTPIITGFVRPLLQSVGYGIEVIKEKEEATQSREIDRIVLPNESMSISNYTPADAKQGEKFETPDEEVQKEKKESQFEELSPNDNIIEKESSFRRKKEFRVHAELTTPGSTEVAVAEMETHNRKFRIHLPRFYGGHLLFLSAADTTKWNEKKVPQWIQVRILPDDEMPAIEKLRYMNNLKGMRSVQVTWPYPRFVSPFDFYQNHLRSSSDTLSTPSGILADGTRVLKEVAVRASHSGLREFDDSQPVLVLDAYEAENAVFDAGITRSDVPIIRTYVGDYGLPYGASNYAGFGERKMEIRYGLGPTRRALPQYIGLPIDSIYHPKYLKSLLWSYSEMSPGERRDYGDLSKLDRYYIYTDFCPRLEGDKRYQASNYPNSKLVIYPYPDGSRRYTYENRRYAIFGFDVPAEFYSPDYSRQTPPEPSDYRRTLYWNPNVKLDHEGRANIRLWNCSRATRPQVEAAGQTTDGTLLWNKTQE